MGWRISASTVPPPSFKCSPAGFRTFGGLKLTVAIFAVVVGYLATSLGWTSPFLFAIDPSRALALINRFFVPAQSTGTAFSVDAKELFRFSR